MTAHTHREFVEGCYRCDLNRDEPHAFQMASDSPACEWCGRGRSDPLHEHDIDGSTDG